MQMRPSKPDAQKRVCASEMGCGIITAMNIEYTGKYDAVAAMRFAGNVYDRIARDGVQKEGEADVR